MCVGLCLISLSVLLIFQQMFDQLRNLAPKDLRVVHIAASPPDNSQHPCWNQLPLLDSLTWELLPVELKKVSKFNSLLQVCMMMAQWPNKRNIQLSGINTSSELACFTELYTQVISSTKCLVHILNFTRRQREIQRRRGSMLKSYTTCSSMGSQVLHG